MCLHIYVAITFFIVTSVTDVGLSAIWRAPQARRQPSVRGEPGGSQVKVNHAQHAQSGVKRRKMGIDRDLSSALYCVYKYFIQ